MKPDLFYTELIDGSNVPSSCPRCGAHDEDEDAQRDPRLAGVLKGPFTRYERRETELYFDLKKKYLQCASCGSELTILDFQVLVEEMSATLSPVKARPFSMKMMGLYRDSHECAMEVLSILRGDFSLGDEREDDYLEKLEELLHAPCICLGM